MPKKKVYQQLTHVIFYELIRGGLRQADEYAQLYSYVENNRTRIILDGFDIQADSGERLEVERITEPLELVFRNCKLPKMTVKASLHSLIVENCIGPEIRFEEKRVDTFLLAGTNSAISAIIIKPDTVTICDLRSPVDTVSMEGADREMPKTAYFSSYIKKLELNSCDLWESTFTGQIDECLISDSNIPFNQHIAIKSLSINDFPKSVLTLRGLFEHVHLSNIDSSIHLEDFTCLGNMSITNQYSSKNAYRVIDFSNTYIGGKLRVNHCVGVIRVQLDGETNKYLLIDDLHIRHKLKGLEFQTMHSDLAIDINQLSFEDIQIPKDTFWTLQGLLCRSISFSNFKNAGQGNISTTYGSYFTPANGTFEEVRAAYPDASSLGNAVHQEPFIDFDPGTIKGSLIMNYSDLGKINFIDDDFGDFTLYFNSTKLSEIYLAGSKLPKTVKASNLGGLPESLRHQERIANSQLKKLHEQQGDMLAANDYFANEMNAYYYSLNWQKHFWERLPLALNRWSSNHGQSWIRALICTLIVSILFYILFILCLGYWPANPFDHSSWHTFLLIASFYLDFLNPLHKLDTFGTLALNHNHEPGLRFIDGISRIFVAYCVYQLIQAFRKHGRTK